MDAQQVLNLLSFICRATGAVCLGKGFWPPKVKFAIQKETIRRGGKIIEEKPAIPISELVSEDEVPDGIKKNYCGNDLILYRWLHKKSDDLRTIKFWGCIGTAFILLGCVLAVVAIFISKPQ